MSITTYQTFADLDAANAHHHTDTGIPADWPVQPITLDPNNRAHATCGHCGLTWDDSVPTSMTPAPSGRCPFEQFHPEPTGRVARVLDLRIFLTGNDAHVTDSINAVLLELVESGHISDDLTMWTDDAEDGDLGWIWSGPNDVRHGC